MNSSDALLDARLHQRTLQASTERAGRLFRGIFKGGVSTRTPHELEQVLESAGFRDLRRETSEKSWREFPDERNKLHDEPLMASEEGFDCGNG